MRFLDILSLAWRNLREAKLRATLTTIGVIVGVAVIVIMVSFGLGLERNTVAHFRELDLFNEITVYGRTLSSIVSAQLSQLPGSQGADGSTTTRGQREAKKSGTERSSARTLDEAAVAEIAMIPGVAYVEPNVSFSAYARVRGRVVRQTVSGARVPNQATRFRRFAAGKMIGETGADEAVVDGQFARDFGYDKAADAMGQTVELLAPPEEEKQPSAMARRDTDAVSRPGSAAPSKAEDEDEAFSFFGLPLDMEAAEEAETERLVAASFRIVGVLQNEVDGGNQGGSGGRRVRGLMPAAGLYIPLAAAESWAQTHRDPMNQVALQLARASGALDPNKAEGYPSAVVRVDDPGVLMKVKQRLAELGFNSFSIVDQLDELQKIFLIANSAFGLLGGISLLVASFGIANTMIMSIYERTREIGIMKAIGAEDREIKLIFFVEAALIGLAGGIIGVLAGWGIEAAANRLAYQFILRPRNASFIDFFALPPWLWMGAILFAMLISVLAALYPAARAARIDPVKALRHD